MVWWNLQRFLIGIEDDIVWISEGFVIWIWYALTYVFVVGLKLQGWNDINLQNYVMQNYANSLGEVKVRELLAWWFFSENILVGWIQSQRVADLVVTEREYTPWWFGMKKDETQFVLACLTWQKQR